MYKAYIFLVNTVYRKPSKFQTQKKYDISQDQDLIKNCILFFFIFTTQYSVDIQIKLVWLFFFFYSINGKR